MLQTIVLFSIQLQDSAKVYNDTSPIDAVSPPLIGLNPMFDRDAILEEDDEMTDEIDDDIEHLRPSRKMLKIALISK